MIKQSNLPETTHQRKVVANLQTRHRCRNIVIKTKHNKEHANDKDFNNYSRFRRHNHHIYTIYSDTFSTDFRNIPVYCKSDPFICYQDFTSSALSAETAVIMAHNKGLELGADMVLLLKGGHRNNALGTLLELLLLKVSNCFLQTKTCRVVTSSPTLWKTCN